MRWSRIIAVLLLVALVGTAGFYWYWGNRSWSRLVAAKAAVKAAGDPITAADLVQPPVPDDRNAALLLQKAAVMIDENAPSWQALDDLPGSRYIPRLPLPADELTILDIAVEPNKPVFPIVSQASRLSEFDWQIDYTVGIFNLDFKPVYGQRRLATLLQAGAFVAHQREDDAKAIELADQIGFIADAVGTQPTLISSLVSTGISAMQAQLLSDMAPSLRISADEPTAVSPQRLRQVIDSLLEESARRATIRRGLAGERALQQDMMLDMLAGRIGTAAPQAQNPKQQNGSKVMAIILGPFIKDNALLMIRQMNQMIDALEAPDWPTYRRRVSAAVDQQRRARYRYMLATLLLSSLDRAPETTYRVQADRHLAAAALAIRWYALEHDGSLPDSLDQLVPKYLPHVPLDPLVGGAKRIGYVKDAQRPRVYHVGENGIDDGGREPDPWASQRDNDRLSDAIVHLRHQPRPTTRSSDED